MAKKSTYSEAINELESILKELGNNQNVDIDLITEKVKRANELLLQCKKQLHKLDAELEKEFDKFNPDESK